MATLLQHLKADPAPRLVTVTSGEPLWRAVALEHLKTRVRPAAVSHMDASESSVDSQLEAFESLRAGDMLVVSNAESIGFSVGRWLPSVARRVDRHYLLDTDESRTGDDRLAPPESGYVHHIDCPSLSHEPRRAKGASLRGSWTDSQLVELGMLWGLNRQDAVWLAEAAPTNERWLAAIRLWRLTGSTSSIRLFAAPSSDVWDRYLIIPGDSVSLLRQVRRRVRQFAQLSACRGLGLTPAQMAQRTSLEASLCARLYRVAISRSPSGWLTILAEVVRLQDSPGAPVEGLLRRWLA